MKRLVIAAALAALLTSAVPALAQTTTCNTFYDGAYSHTTCTTQQQPQYPRYTWPTPDPQALAEARAESAARRQACENAGGRYSFWGKCTVPQPRAPLAEPMTPMPTVPPNGNQ